MQHARAKKSSFGRITSVEAGDAKEIGGMMATVDEKVNHVSGRHIFSTAKENSTESDDLSEFVREVKKGLRGFLFWPVTTETDGGVDISGMAVVKDVDEG